MLMSEAGQDASARGREELLQRMKQWFLGQTREGISCDTNAVMAVEAQQSP